MLDFNVIKFLGINTRTGTVFSPLPVRWEFSSPGWVKINTDGAARGYPSLATSGGIFRGSMREFIGVSLHFFMFRLLWLLSFMELYMLWRKFKRWDLLMYALNVILPCFVLRLLLGLLFRGCFVIDGILVLIVVEKSSLGLLIFCEGNVCADKLSNLGFIHRKSFHWYNRLPSSLFLEFFMNKYSLPMYRFC